MSAHRSLAAAAAIHSDQRRGASREEMQVVRKDVHGRVQRRVAGRWPLEQQTVEGGGKGHSGNGDGPWMLPGQSCRFLGHTLCGLAIHQPIKEGRTVPQAGY
jgi:hypothetical protein